MNDLSFEKIGNANSALGIFTLNRPKALNACSLSMIQSLSNALHDCQDDPSIKAIVIRSLNPAFCAGGDIRALYNVGQKNPEQAHGFFTYEYRLNYQIACYPKPYISFLNGVTMGGGIGIALHGSHPIATENTILAMPETGIGFFPDIGSSYFLSRIRDEIGTYLGLSGTHFRAATALSLKLIQHHISSEHLDALLNALIETPFNENNAHQSVDEILNRFHSPPKHHDEWMQHTQTIATCFQGNDVHTIFGRLQHHTKDEAWAHNTLENLKKKSPTSLSVTLQQLRYALDLNLADCLKMDYRLSHHFLHQHDIYEGIRALIIDKDKTPHWQPASLAKIKPQDIDAYFQHLGEKELET